MSSATQSKVTTTAATDTGTPVQHGAPAAALTAAVLGFFVITLDVSGVNVALPAIRADLGGTLSGLQWVADSYTLMFAALMLSAGALSDRVGAKNAYGWGLAAFTIASVACSVSPNLALLITARTVQGCAAAVIVPSSLALIRQAFPEAEARARGIALWTVGGALAIAAGPVLGGVLTTELSWRMVFALNVPAGIVASLFLLRTGRSPRHHVTFDLSGQLTAILALASLTFAVIQGGRNGFTAIVTASVLVAIASATAFVLVELRRRNPILPLALFRHSGVTVPVIAGFACNAAFYGGVFVLSLFFQDQRGQSALSAGLMFAPMALITANFNYLSPKLVQRFGPRVVIVAGLLVGAAGCGGLILVNTHTQWWVTAALMVPLGIGGSLAMPALTTLMLDTVPNERAGTAAALLNTSRQTGGAISIAVFGGLLAGDFAAGMRDSLALAAGGLLMMAVLSRIVLPHRTDMA